MATLAEAACYWHSLGLCVIPVKPRDKAPLLSTWEQFHTRQSTAEEVARWWTQTPDANIGIVHGVNNYITIDIDHDAGMLALLRQAFPKLTAGVIELSGSGEGYHIPMFLTHLPDLGWDNSKERPRGNMTWKTKRGAVNIRCRWCQSVVPPSIHPSGNAYTFIQRGQITRADNLSALITFLNQLDPQPVRKRQPVSQPVNANGSIKAHFQDILAVFRSLGFNDATQTEGDEIRIMGHGGLLVRPDTGMWYCFSDEIGGDAIDAFGWVRFGQRWNRYDKTLFRQILTEMETAATLSPQPSNGR